MVIVKQPFDIGFLAIEAPAAAIEAHPEVTAWAVGGHSLGGVVGVDVRRLAPRHGARPRALGVLPRRLARDRAGFASPRSRGIRRRLATPADIEASRVDLPGDTAYTVVEGGVHSYFGDYGEQPGDGVPTVSREEAQRQIVAATVALIESVPGG